LQSEQTKSELFCWYDFKIHSEFKINPLKVEILSRRPLLFQFYDLINKGDAKELIDRAEPRLEISMVRPESGILKRSPGRTSFSTFICNNLTTAARRLTSRIHHITKLNPRDIKYQLASYTYGGTYNVHHDSVFNPSQIYSEFFRNHHRFNEALLFL